MDIVNKIRTAVEAEGYEIAHGQEGYGEHVFGLVILVKMSERKLCDKDGIAFYRAADAIKKNLETNSQLLDPEGPARREHHRAEIEGIYKTAGVDTIYMEEIPNGYGGNDPFFVNRPWFRVTSKIGHVVIGWRKRVIEINWKDTVVKKHGDELFSAEDTTRLETGVHAWGTIKAADYIRRLHEAA